MGVRLWIWPRNGSEPGTISLDWGFHQRAHQNVLHLDCAFFIVEFGGDGEQCNGMEQWSYFNCNEIKGGALTIAVRL